MAVRTAIQSALTNPLFIAVWSVFVLGSVAVLVRDLRRNNGALGGLMKAVWLFTVLYSGPLGLAVYWYSGRTQIDHDSLWRRGFRSVSHCYSGCGAGEITGVIVGVGLLALGNLYVALVTFALAYVFGYAMTVGPLMEEGVPFREATVDAFYTETASITVMEIVAIGTDIWLAGEAGMTDVLFWSALVFSLTLGLLAAYPVNVLLIKFDVKEGMMNPAEMA
ncbi:DUF4396 domain-containing protein [Haloterrigena salifodinae]|uniref:DUF4396 domain-containing protein n=1 Tax=Haloterrigena salifodinae TaxID=2675099 RepID=A0A8T8DZQ7_9EURY|nr:DUF4396 domain-containing protein [Haloterrigena salifodinae]QRV14733.1 DUF4396 domain-containing protein [Haloterrigena salifodinae]